MTDHHFDWNLIDRFVAGECSPADLAEIERWFAADPSRRAFVEAMVPASSRTCGWQTDAEWARLADRTGIEPRATLPAQLRLVGEMPSRPFLLPTAPLRPLMRAAAVLLVLGGVGGVWWAITTRSAPREAAVASAPPREFATTRGERAEMRLSDGTRVKLGADSKLRVPVDFGVTARELELEGQAYFEVTYDAERPFTVRAANAVTQVLGTRFNVRAYSDDDRVEVLVAEGRVSVGARSDRRDNTSLRADDVLLTPGQLARIGANGQITLRQRVDVARYLGWTEGRLVFRNIPLRDVAAELSRWYGVDIHIADVDVGSRELTAALDNAPLAEALHLIAVSLEVVVDWTRNVVRIGKPSN